MLSFKDKVAAAQKAGRKSTTIMVSLDLGFTEQRDALLEQIAVAALDVREGLDPAAPLRKKLEKIEAQEADTLVEVKVYRADPIAWSQLSAANAGNLANTCRAAAMVDGRIVEDGEEVTQTPEEWDAFFKVCPPSDFQAILAAVYVLNDKAPADRVERLKKSLATTQGSAPS